MRTTFLGSRAGVGCLLLASLSNVHCAGDGDTSTGGTGGFAASTGGGIAAQTSGGTAATSSGGSAPGGLANLGAGGTSVFGGTGGVSVTANSGGANGNGGASSSGGVTNGGATSSGGATNGGGGGTSGGGTSGGGAGNPGNCGMRSGMRGKTTRTVTVGGTKRTYIAYLPQSGNATTPVPLIYVFHGASQTGQNLYDITQYSALADKENIAAVFPDGQGASSASGTGSLTPWNVTDGPALCGLGALVSNPSAVDLQFVDAIRTDLAADQCIDAGHVFATGFSMGGYFTHHIACDRPDFKAAAPHSGATMADLSTCKTTHVPIIIFHGTADPLINNACDDPTATPQTGFPASATLWAKKNGCMDTYKTIAEPGTMSADTGQCYLYDGCPADGQVEACTFTNMPHAWAGAAQCPGCIGTGAGYASATQLEWDFFKKYAW
ncbi:MAG TPA: alpha/beta hydrolase-fold protein [Polyangiaceae bacterium]|jgi:poly(3-hydroxybutyrate) depolymerase|nr:alpha/beta hydrolase-fold protein [Polyangiaceae bacterium]